VKLSSMGHPAAEVTCGFASAVGSKEGRRPSIMPKET
jgi:hypothetical protein